MLCTDAATDRGFVKARPAALIDYRKHQAAFFDVAFGTKLVGRGMSNDVEYTPLCR